MQINPDVYDFRKVFQSFQETCEECTCCTPECAEGDYEGHGDGGCWFYLDSRERAERAASYVSMRMGRGLTKDEMLVIQRHYWKD
jgi:hypothetical protein